MSTLISFALQYFPPLLWKSSSREHQQYSRAVTGTFLTWLPCDLYNLLVKQALLSSPFFRWGNCSSKNLNSLPQIIKPTSSRPGIWTHSSNSEGICQQLWDSHFPLPWSEQRASENDFSAHRLQSRWWLNCGIPRLLCPQSGLCPLFPMVARTPFPVDPDCWTGVRYNGSLSPHLHPCTVRPRSVTGGCSPHVLIAPLMRNGRSRY